MISENLNKQAVNTQRRLGLACSSQTAYRHLQSVAMKYKESIKEAISTAIENEYLITVNLDDYHNIHSKQRPISNKMSMATHMGTAVFRIHPSVKAIRIADVRKFITPKELLHISASTT